MRTILLTLGILLLTSTVYAIDVQLEWDANTESDLAGYRLYHRLSGEEYTDYINIIAPATTITRPYENGRHYWVLTAYDTVENESDYSNEATVYLQEVDVTPPNAPGLRVTVIVESN